LLADNKVIEELNAAYRGINKTTDVLSFPQISENLEIGTMKCKKNEKNFSPTDYLLGDVVINIQMAALYAEKSGTGFYYELSRLLLHGVLHLLGYDHEQSRYKARKMREKEQEILSAFKKMD